jgi:Holliday junction resolvase RusA-like endonuclease
VSALPLEVQRRLSTDPAAIRLAVPGEPVPKGRPRFDTRGERPRAYTPKATSDAEEEIRWALRAAGVRRPLEGDVRVHLEFFTTHTKTAGPKATADLDNYVKTVFDACNEFAFVDDRQVVQLYARIVRDPKLVPYLYLAIDPT